MNGYPNLSNVLKNYIGKRFWNDIYGYVTLVIADDECLVFLTKIESLALYLNPDGTVPGNGKMGVYPRAFSEDWNEFIEKHKDN